MLQTHGQATSETERWLRSSAPDVFLAWVGPLQYVCLFGCLAGWFDSAGSLAPWADQKTASIRTELKLSNSSRKGLEQIVEILRILCAVLPKGGKPAIDKDGRPGTWKITYAKNEAMSICHYVLRQHSIRLATAADLFIACCNNTSGVTSTQVYEAARHTNTHLLSKAETFHRMTAPYFAGRLSGDGTVFGKQETKKQYVYMYAEATLHGPEAKRTLEAAKAKFPTPSNPTDDNTRLAWRSEAAWDLFWAMRPYMAWYGRRMDALADSCQCPVGASA